MHSFSTYALIMCNKYAARPSVSELRQLMLRLELNLSADHTADNLPEFPAIYPDQDAPVIIADEPGAASLTLMRWGFPPIPGKKSVITNIRNLKSRWWSDVNRTWLLEPNYRCLAPFSEFAEPVRRSTWFAVPDGSTAFFAGIWRPYSGKRLMAVPGEKRRKQIEGDYKLFAFLTTDANDIVRPVHEKAMPVILNEPEEQREWLAGGQASLALQRPLPNEKLHAVRRDET